MVTRRAQARTEMQGRGTLLVYGWRDMGKGTETRKRIIAKSAPLFNRKGFEACSMQDIVEAVGLEKGGVYGHFANKEALALAAFDHAWTETCTSRTEGMDSTTGAIAKLKRHVHNAVNRPSFPGGCPLANTIIDSDDGNPALKKRARRGLREWQTFLEDIVKEGQDQNQVRPDIDAHDVVAVLISLVEGAMFLDRFEKKTGFLESAQRHITSYLDTLAP